MSTNPGIPDTREDVRPFFLEIENSGAKVTNLRDLLHQFPCYIIFTSLESLSSLSVQHINVTLYYLKKYVEGDRNFALFHGDYLQN